MRYTARQYAEALRDIAGDTETLQQLLGDVETFDEHLGSDRAIRSFFTSRTISSDEQTAALRTVFQDVLSKRTQQSDDTPRLAAGSGRGRAASDSFRAARYRGGGAREGEPHRERSERGFPLALEFLATLCTNQQMHLLSRIVAAARVFLLHATDSVPVRVESAVELSRAQQADIEHVLGEQLEYHPVVTYATIPDRIGGLAVLVGASRAWDGTVQGKLRRLQLYIQSVTTSLPS